MSSDLPQDSPERPAADAESGATPARRSAGPRSAVTVFAAILLAVSLGAALWFGGGWIRAAFLTDGPRAEARDAALDGAQQAALNITTMDIGDVPGSLARARSSMTGAILDSATKNQQQSEQMAAESGVRMESTVLSAALTSLNSERDAAAALVVLQVTEYRPDRTTARYRYTWNLDMTEDGGVWKVEQVASLGQPVLLDGQGAAGPAEPGAPATEPGAAEPAPATEPRPGS